MRELVDQDVRVTDAQRDAVLARVPAEAPRLPRAIVTLILGQGVEGLLCARQQNPELVRRERLADLIARLMRRHVFINEG